MIPPGYNSTIDTHLRLSPFELRIHTKTGEPRDKVLSGEIICPDGEEGDYL